MIYSVYIVWKHTFNAQCLNTVGGWVEFLSDSSGKDAIMIRTKRNRYSFVYPWMSLFTNFIKLA